MTGPAALLPSPEQDLITLARRGDRLAFGELVQRHRDGVMNVVYRLCGDPDLAEETAQEAFIRAWQNLDRYKSEFPFRNWIYKIAVNLAYDALRRRKPQINIEEISLQSHQGDPEQALESRERAERVRQCVLALPPDSRSALVLREYEGLTYQEIAATLDIPLGTVMSRLSYARNRLRQALADYLEVR